MNTLTSSLARAFVRTFARAGLVATGGVGLLLMVACGAPAGSRSAGGGLPGGSSGSGGTAPSTVTPPSATQTAQPQIRGPERQPPVLQIDPPSRSVETVATPPAPSRPASAPGTMTPPRAQGTPMPIPSPDSFLPVRPATAGVAPAARLAVPAAAAAPAAAVKPAADPAKAKTVRQLDLRKLKTPSAQ
ncbi:hypothetical protein [Methylibium sp.]|uniref:hypothetical protein n=1 Tax=Methylibium sp. TaxID=2067992 RepID=UPI003D096373